MIGDKEIRDRMELLDEQTAKAWFVWRMAYGRWNTLKIEGVSDDDPRVRSAMTQIRNTALVLDAVFRAYAQETEPLS